MTETGMPPADTTTSDERALDLRRQGKSLKTIARELGLDRPIDANAAFNRGLRRRPVEEQAAVRTEEEGRLNALAESVRGNGKLSAEDIERRLRAIARLRTALMAE